MTEKEKKDERPCSHGKSSLPPEDPHSKASSTSQSQNLRREPRTSCTIWQRSVNLLAMHKIPHNHVHLNRNGISFDEAGLRIKHRVETLQEMTQRGIAAIELAAETLKEELEKRYGQQTVRVTFLRLFSFRRRNSMSAVQLQSPDSLRFFRKRRN